MQCDTKKQRGDKSFVFANIKAGIGVETIARLVGRRRCMG